MDLHLSRIAELFDDCLRTAAVFERPNRPLVERVVAKKEGREWIVLAAGVDPERSSDFFAYSGRRKEFASIPISVYSGAQMCILLVMRPFDFGSESLAPHHHVTLFAPGEDIPYVAIREGYVRLTHLPNDNNAHLDSLRWELDVVEGLKIPMERSLREWHSTIGSNPAHPPSHLHFNSLPKSMDRASDVNSKSTDLRLSMGVPNPLALVLSLSNWIQNL